MLYVMLVGAYPFERPEDKHDNKKLQKMIQVSSPHPSLFGQSTAQYAFSPATVSHVHSKLGYVTTEIGLLDSTQHQGSAPAAGLSDMVVTGHKHVVRCFASIPQGMHECMRQLAAAK